MSDAKSETRNYVDVSHLHPYLLIRQVVKVVPAARVALGLFAIVAILGVLVLVRSSPVVAIVGLVGTAAIMFAILLFASLASARSRSMSFAISALTWSLALATIAATFLLFSSVFFGWPISLRHSLLPVDPKPVSHEFPTAIAITFGIAQLLIPIALSVWKYRQRRSMDNMRAITSAMHAELIKEKSAVADRAVLRMTDVINRLNPEERNLLRKILESPGDLENQDEYAVEQLLDKFGEVGDEKQAESGNAVSGDHVTE